MVEGGARIRRKILTKLRLQLTDYYDYRKKGIEEHLNVHVTIYELERTDSRLVLADISGSSAETTTTRTLWELSHSSQRG
jgi:hypothetical protein